MPVAVLAAPPEVIEPQLLPGLTRRLPVEGQHDLSLRPADNQPQEVIPAADAPLAVTASHQPSQFPVHISLQ
ncbi:hypothetical protein IR083_18390 [Dysgonomonas sp. GY75]|uniref:hypothetical protein n=1 Tax=Dysgonomonas sp. GY75 TaxID=2780419 RepID=UPI0018842696|nr:hypothetical protein [Dysgonomonas sp. GY75]MBF0650795.1 hypothetical protein [Dysgonomonas sp. GY75]